MAGEQCFAYVTKDNSTVRYEWVTPEQRIELIRSGAQEVLPADLVKNFEKSDDRHKE